MTVENAWVFSEVERQVTDVEPSAVGLVGDPGANLGEIIMQVSVTGFVGSAHRFLRPSAPTGLRLRVVVQCELVVGIPNELGKAKLGGEDWVLNRERLWATL